MKPARPHSSKSNHTRNTMETDQISDKHLGQSKLSESLNSSGVKTVNSISMEFE